MTELSRIYSAIWCQIILLRLDGVNTETIEYLMGQLEHELFKIKNND